MRRLIIIPQAISSPQSLIPIPTPSLSATATGTNTISLVASYTGPPTLNQYQFYEFIGGSWSLLASQSSASYVVSGLTANTTYNFYVSITTTETPSRTSQSGFASATTNASSGTVQWHPGHYLLTNNNTVIYPWTGTLPSSVPGEIAACNAAGSNCLGYACTIAMAAMEPTEGNYQIGAAATSGAGPIDVILSMLNPGKLLIVNILASWIGHANGLNDTVPNYIQTNPIYGSSPNSGSYGYWYSYNQTPVGKGGLLAYWRPLVAARLAALYTAIGTAYNGNASVEAIGNYDESVNTSDVNSGSDITTAAFITGTNTWQQAAVAACPNTNVMCQINFVNGDISSSNAKYSGDMVANAYNQRVAMGGPDVFGQTGDPSDRTWAQSWFLGAAGTNNSGQYPGNLYGGSTPGSLKGKMAYINCVQGEPGANDYVYTPLDLVNEANNVLGITHMMWMYNGGSSGVGSWSAASPNGVLAVINANPIVNTAYPPQY
jgi:hypothetical protein